jgi:hypothetical protein
MGGWPSKPFLGHHIMLTVTLCFKENSTITIMIKNIESFRDLEFDPEPDCNCEITTVSGATHYVIETYEEIFALIYKQTPQY